MTRVESAERAIDFIIGGNCSNEEAKTVLLEEIAMSLAAIADAAEPQVVYYDSEKVISFPQTEKEEGDFA